MMNVLSLVFERGAQQIDGENRSAKAGKQYATQPSLARPQKVLSTEE
jgi:hypothetical protein